jgi:hypothetical protein
MLTSFQPEHQSGKPMTKTTLLPYEWYRDYYLTDATGTYQTVEQEITRLNNLFSGYTFTTVGAPGLLAYEWGYYPSQNLKIIYSNMSEQ